MPVIDRWAGIEYSVVPVPCNPEAEMLAVAKGVEAGVFDAGVAELITKAMTPFLAGWSSPVPPGDEVGRPAVSTGTPVRPINGDAEGGDAAGAALHEGTPTHADGAAGEAEAKAALIEQAASAAFVRPQTILAAIRRAVEDAREELPLLIRRELREAYARATGKV